MGLYLCIFDGDTEIDGIEVGSYADYGYLLDTVTRVLEAGIPGSKYPTLILHSDSDGLWTVDECRRLHEELCEMSEAFKKLPPVEFHSDWQRDVAKSIGLLPQTLYDCFIDVDGEPLLERMINLCKLALEVQRPILFQ